MSQNKLENSSAPMEIEERNEVEIDLLELFYRLIEKAKYIVAAAVIGMLIMAVYSFILARPVYEATSKLYVMNASDSAINLSDLQIGSYLTSDYQEVFDTWEVHEMVIQNLNLSYTYEELEGMLTITNPSNTRMLYITVASGNPQEAATLANEYASVARNYISDTMQTDAPSVMSQALVPTDPVSPRKLLNMAIGFILGAFIMAAVVVVQFILDDKIKTGDDIRRYADMPTLAIVPTNSGSARGGSGKSSGGRSGQYSDKRGGGR